MDLSKSEATIAGRLCAFLAPFLVLYLITGWTILIVIGCLPGVYLYVSAMLRYVSSIR